MLAPNLSEHDNFSVYFPNEAWFDLRTYSFVELTGFRTVNSKLNEIAPIFLRGGKTMFMQNVDKVKNSFDLDNNFDIIVALKEDEKRKTSIGYLPALNDYNNMNDVENCIEKDCLFKILSVFVEEFNELNIKITRPKFTGKNFAELFLTKFVILGINTKLLNFKKYETNLNRITDTNHLQLDYNISIKNDFCFEIIITKSHIRLLNDLEIFIKFLI